MKIDVGKRFALLLAASDSDYVKKIHGGYFNVFVEAFGGEGETWDLYRVVEGEFPQEELLSIYDGFVVSGSPADAHGNDLWVLQLCLLVKTIVSMKKRVLGICFGHQLLCRALGGRLGRACAGWDIGIRKLFIEENLPLKKYFEDLREPPTSLCIIECHQDEVLELPAGAKVMAFSERTAVEMFSFEDHVMGIQGHPEYTKGILCNLIDRLAGDGAISSSFAEEAKASVEAKEPDRKLWETICRAFLKGR